MNIKFILPTSREGFNTRLSLDDQPKNVLKEIQKEIKDKTHYQVHLIGYSQGGLVAAALERLCKDKDTLHIASATFISTPFLGVGAMNTTKEDLNEFLKNAEQPLSALAPSASMDPEELKKGMKRAQKVLPIVGSCIAKPFTKGLTALHPANQYTKELAGDIRSGSEKIAHLIVASYASFEDLFDMDATSAKKIDLAYQKLLKHNLSRNAKIEDNRMKNDTMVPLDSQLARWGSIERLDLAGIDDKGREVSMADDCINTKAYVFAKTPHAWNLPIISGALYIEKGRPVLEAREVVRCVADFLSEQMEAIN